MLAFLALIASAVAPAPAAPPAIETRLAEIDYQVALVVNGVEAPAIVAMRENAGLLWIAAAALRQAGIALGGTDGQVEVTGLPGITATFDREGQRLLLDVPTALLPTRRLSADPAEHVAPTIDPGALLNYDLYVQRSAGRTSAALWSEQRAFGRYGTIANTGVLRRGAAFGNGYVRLDTSFRRVDEAHALTVTAGDLITGALPWTVPVRAGGVQVARSFRTRPDLVTVPLPAFAGEAALPSAVDLFIDGYRQRRDDVAPGRFVLDTGPVVNGAGEARIMTTDTVGRQIATVIPFYVAPELLRPGLTDFAVDAGVLRRSYGLRSIDYGRAIASGSVRHGLTDRITVEGHGEAARGLMQAGGGIVWSPGLIGAVRVAAATSAHDGRTGLRHTIGYSYVARTYSLGVERTARSRDFADLASFDLARFDRSRRVVGSGSFRVTGSARVGSIGSIGIGYIAARARDGTRARIASASMSAPLGRRLSAFAAADYDLATRRMSAQLRLVLPLGRNTVAGAGLSRPADGAIRYQADIARSVATDGGFGWSASAAGGEGGGLIGQANGTFRGGMVELQAGVARSPGVSNIYGSVTGAIALLGGKPYLANQLPDAFALVTTGMAGVPVYYENQPVGRTGRDGKLFVPRVVAYHPGRFGIDIAQMPAAVTADTIATSVALREGTGGVIRLPVTRTRSAVVRLVDAKGADIPPGTPVTFSTGAASVVGWDGMVLIDRADGPVTLVAALPGGGTCRAQTEMPRDGEAVVALGMLPCR